MRVLERVKDPQGQAPALGTGGGRRWKRDPGAGQGKEIWHGGEEEEEEGKASVGAQDRSDGGGERMVSETGRGG